MRNAPMTPLTTGRGPAIGVAIVTLLLLIAGCSTDSPTAPTQNPGPAPPGPSAGWSVTVSASPNALQAGSTDPSQVSFTVRRSDNGQLPPNGTTLVVTTTLGDIGSLASGVQSATLSLVNGSAQLLLYPGDIQGSAQIRAQIESSFGTANVQISGTVTFFLSAVSPSTGHPTGGDSVSITGGGFKAPVRVTFNGVVAQVQSTSSDRIRVMTPGFQVAPGGSLQVNVAVTNDLNGLTEATDTLAGAFTYTADPAPRPIQVFSVSPNSGPNEGGTQIVIAGQGFESPVQVLFGTGSPGSFNGIEGTVESVTSNEVVVRTPSATGFGQDNRDASVSVLVRNTRTGDGAVLPSGFRYGVEIRITSIGPSVGPPEGGQRVTIFGQGFDEPVAVSIANVGGQPVLSVTGTEIIFRTTAVQQLQCQDVTGTVSVTNVETGATAEGPSYTFEVDATAPIITSLSPTRIPQAGGVPVTISGANFSNPIRVTVGNNLQSIVSLSPTAIVFTAPPLDGLPQTEACDDNADGTEGERYVDTTANLALNVTLLVNGCEDSVTVGFVYEPADRSCRNDIGVVTPTPPPVASFDAEVSGPTSANFTDTSTGGTPTSWAWDFGDGETSSLPNPGHDYGAGAPGTTFTVELTVSNAGGSSTAQKTVSFPP